VVKKLIDRCALIELLRTFDGALRENGATGLFIFGSRAIGQERSDSDLDLFIDYDRQAKIPNIFRLMQIEDCYHESYRRARADGSAWTSGDCSRRVIRGGSWVNVPGDLRSANRDSRNASTRGNYLGFRVGRTLLPP